MVKEVVKKVFTVVILLAIAGLAWSQRAELTACADEVRDDRRRRAPMPDTTCTFFGQEVTVPGRATLLGPDGATTTTTTPVG